MNRARQTSRVAQGKPLQDYLVLFSVVRGTLRGERLVVFPLLEELFVVNERSCKDHPLSRVLMVVVLIAAVGVAFSWYQGSIRTLHVWFSLQSSFVFVPRGTNVSLVR